MSASLKRYYGQQHLHCITCSCYRRLPLLAPSRRKDLFVTILEQVRRRYEFAVLGYVVMPEHIHLLREPKRQNLSTVMQVLKQRVSRQVRQHRRERLWYVHRNPVTRGLVESPEQWRWSSDRCTLLGRRSRCNVMQMFLAVVAD
jgi:putative transposase